MRLTRCTDDSQLRGESDDFGDHYPNARGDPAGPLLMGRIDYQDAVDAATRHEAAQVVQQQVTTLQTEAEMLNQRRTFMRPGDRVFFESIIEGSDILPIRYLELGQVAARPVGRIEVPAIIERGTGYATGFLVAPGLLLTNQHVLRSADWAAAATLTLDAEDMLDGLPRVPRVFRFQPEDLFVADPSLDFALVSVAERATDGTRLADFGFLRLFKQTGKITRDEYASIIQHPNGRQKHLAARNNKVSVYVYDDDLPADQRGANNFLYYQTDTLRGSSGAPVFSDQWYVVALHRRGVPNTRIVNDERVIVRLDGEVATPADSEDAIQYISNEGVRISRILERLRALTVDAAFPMRDSASRALAALDLLHDVGDGPVATPVSVPSILRSTGRTADGRRSGVAFEGLEITRRSLDVFADAEGYDPEFLQGMTIPLPAPSAKLRRALAPRIDASRDYLLPFRHFTTAMHAKRRLPIFAAVNIDGKGRPKGGMGQGRSGPSTHALPKTISRTIRFLATWCSGATSPRVNMSSGVTGPPSVARPISTASRSPTSVRRSARSMACGNGIALSGKWSQKRKMPLADGSLSLLDPSFAPTIRRMTRFGVQAPSPSGTPACASPSVSGRSSRGWRTTSSSTEHSCSINRMN